jgi:hypothetical protein
MPRGQESEVGNRCIRDVSVARAVLGLRGINMRDRQERPRRAARIPGEDAAIGMSSSYGGMICRYSDGRDGAAFNSCIPVS